MAQQAGRKNQPLDGDTGWLIIGGLIALVAVIFGMYWVSVVVDPSIQKNAGASNPFLVIIAQVTGDAPVTWIQVLTFLAQFLVLSGIAALIGFAWMKNRRTNSRIDDRARDMTRIKDVAELSEKQATKDAERLGATGASLGVPLGKLVNNMKPLFASWEWVQIWIMGPRAGKTSCVCVPQIIETEGPVLATSNKRDIVDLTRGPRSLKGTVWVHDVQQIIGEAPSWFWNPLTFVRDMETAEKLADVFRTSASAKDAREDAYFGPTAKTALSRYMYACALGERPITDVYRWVNDEKDFTAEKILREAGQGTIAQALEKDQMVTEKQRDGVYGQMRTWVGILGNPKVAAWVRPNAQKRPELDLEKFVNSTDTLYLISREGGGSARAITAALVMALLTTAEEIAAKQRGGRLSTPLMAVLDEAANVVRWHELPDVYSHYGSRGIVVSTFFQSYSQGIEAYGESGMNKLWSAANVRVAGSGLSEEKFLPFLASLIGDRDVTKRTSSTQRGGRSTTTSLQRERIFDTSDIAQLPRGRAIMTASGQPALLLALQHFSTKPYGDDAKASQDYYEAVIGATTDG